MHMAECSTMQADMVRSTTPSRQKQKTLLSCPQRQTSPRHAEEQMRWLNKAKEKKIKRTKWDEKKEF